MYKAPNSKKALAFSTRLPYNPSDKRFLSHGAETPAKSLIWYRRVARLHICVSCRFCQQDFLLPGGIVDEAQSSDNGRGRARQSPPWRRAWREGRARRRGPSRCRCRTRRRARRGRQGRCARGRRAVHRPHRARRDRGCFQLRQAENDTVCRTGGSRAPRTADTRRLRRQEHPHLQKRAC